jgi:hypothetical protein
VDLANCYNVVAHPIASIALKSYKVKKIMVALMLYVLETMQWYLKTAFGQGENLFGGTKWDRLMGLGQGNASSPRNIHQDPHQPAIWFICKNCSEIYQQLSAQEYEVYQRKMMGRQTMYRTRYLLKDTQEGECPRLVRVIGRD